MAWLYKQQGSSNWWIGYRVNGRQVLRSTGTPDKATAQKELQKIEMLSAAKRNGSLTEEFYRAVIGADVPKISLKAAADEWLGACKGSTAPGTHERYEDVLSEFCEYFHAAPNAPLLTALGSSEVQAFLTHFRNTRAAGTTNLARSILRAFFNHWINAGRISANPAKAVKRFKVTKGDRKKRRPFSTAELTAAFKAASQDDFWRYMVTGGTYTGLRLGDLICLRRGEVDLTHNELVLEAAKTGSVLHIPIAPPFRAELEKRLRGRGKASDFLWPEQAEIYNTRGSGPFGNQFYERVLMRAGLAEKRTHKKKKDPKSHSDRRNVSELSFHSLRHTFISLLKVSGASQSVAKELAGHTSDAVNDLYTSIPIDVLRKAVNQLPEVTT